MVGLGASTIAACWSLRFPSGNPKVLLQLCQVQPSREDMCGPVCSCRLAGWSTTDASLSPSSSSLGKRRGPRETGNPRERKNVHLSVNISFHRRGPTAPWSTLSLSRAFWTRDLRNGRHPRGKRESHGRSWLPVFPWALLRDRACLASQWDSWSSRRSIKVE